MNILKSGCRVAELKHKWEKKKSRKETPELYGSREERTLLNVRHVQKQGGGKGLLKRGVEAAPNKRTSGRGKGELGRERPGGRTRKKKKGGGERDGRRKRGQRVNAGKSRECWTLKESIRKGS